MPISGRLAGRAAVVSVGSVGALAFALTAANADIVYNSLDVTVDSTHEVMNLALGGAAGTTTLQIQIENHPDHAGCNIQGAPNYVALDADSSQTSVATVAFLNGDDTFDTCEDVLTVVVTPLASGDSTITFSIDSDRTSNDPALTFGLDQAAFDVHVADGTITPVETACDADPAAPAWAAAILQANGVKAKSATYSNSISQVAQQMGTGATFPSGGDLVAKNDHPAYEEAVFTYLKTLPGLAGLQAGPAQAKRPGWECTPIS